MTGVKMQVLSWITALPMILAMPAVAAEQTAAARRMTVVATEYRFSPNQLTFERGVAYRLHLENHGEETHELTAPAFFATLKIANPGVLNADRTEILVQPGKTKDLRFVAMKSGPYPFRCADHDWAGMTGEITVK